MENIERKQELQKLMFLLAVKKDRLQSESEEMPKDTKMEIESRGNIVIITKNDKKLYIVKQPYGFAIETVPYSEKEEFTIKNVIDPLEYEVFNTFYDLMKELFGNYVLTNGMFNNDITFSGETKTVTISSDSSYDDSLAISLEPREMPEIIRITIRSNKKGYRNNRITFNYDCNLRGGYYSSFKHLFERLQIAGENRQEKQSQSRMRIK